MAQTLYSPNTQPATSNGNQMTAEYNQIAAAAVGSHTFFTAPFACIVTFASTKYHTAAGATSTVTITKDGAAVAPGAGTAILTAGFDMNTTVDTAIAGVLSATAADYTLAAGDSLATKVATGTATASADVNFTVTLARV